MARTMSLIMATFITVPVVAPVAGAAIFALFGWKSVFWFQFAIATGLAVWAVRLPETLPPERRRSVSPRSWLDAFTTNVDRTARNPNLLVWHRRLHLIDHGSALYIHHSWKDATTIA